MTRGLPSWRAGRSAAAGFLSTLSTLVAVGLIVAGAGPAQAAKRRVGISLAGPHASAIHDVVADVLKHHGFEATSTDLAGDSPDAISAAAKQGKLAAVVVGEVRDGGKRLKLRVYGSGGDLVGEGSWAEAGGIKKLEAVVGRTLWTRVGGSLAKARPPGAGAAEKPAKGEAGGEAEEKEAAEPEKTPTYSRSKESEPTGAASEEAEAPRKHKKKKKTEAEEEPEAPTGPAATALELAVGPRFLWRDLSRSPPVMRFSPYSVGHAPAIGAFVAWYPAAHVRGGWASNIGVAASVEYTPGLVSETNDGTRYPTGESDYWGGVRGRLVFGAAQAALTLGGGQNSFTFASAVGVPSVRYRYARAGVDLRVELPANVSVTLGGGYRYVIGAGADTNFIQESSNYPNSKFTAFDATVGAGYRFVSLLEARAGVDLRRYTMTAGTNIDNLSSATDQYIAVWAQLALLVDGFGHGGQSAAAEKAPPARAPEKAADDEGKSSDE
jgi:hypothetical protein